MTDAVSFADLTTMGVGGRIARFVEPASQAEFIGAIAQADAQRMPLCVIGAGSNMLVSDDDFPGVVVRDARHLISVPGEIPPSGDEGHMVHVVAEAGCNWDDFVAFCVDRGLEGVEGLSGIPGSVGASVVQNIGAYGQEVRSVVHAVQVWDRQECVVADIPSRRLGFGYRTSLLKRSMYRSPAIPDGRWFPTPRYVVLSVTFALRSDDTGRVGYDQLADALEVHVGDRLPTKDIRAAVLRVRAGKGMLEDATRYATAAMRGTRSESNVELALAAQRRQSRVSGRTNGPGAGDGDRAMRETMPDVRDRHSCGSFFMNPVLDTQHARALPPGAPRFAAVLPDGTEGVKTSAAWLIDHAGFHKGFSLEGHADSAVEPLEGGVAVRKDAAGASMMTAPVASVSTSHTLALTNRGGATARDIQQLARAIQDGVERAFSVRLVPEPVVIGLDLS